MTPISENVKAPASGLPQAPNTLAHHSGEVNVGHGKNCSLANIANQIADIGMWSYGGRMPHDTGSTHNSSDHSDHRGADHERAFGSQWWEHHYQQSDPASPTTPSPYITSELGDLSPGTALDAGCGTGADAVWLAQQGWDVTAVDISPTAIARARELATRQAPGVQQIAWVVGDLASWRPQHAYDLVISQYVHPDAPLEQFIQRLTEAVAPGGTLLVVGHDHSDIHSSTHAPRNASLDVGDISALLDPDRWKIETAETRIRQMQHAATRLTHADIVIKAQRKRTPETVQHHPPTVPDS